MVQGLGEGLVVAAVQVPLGLDDKPPCDLSAQRTRADNAAKAAFGVSPTPDPDMTADGARTLGKWMEKSQALLRVCWVVPVGRRPRFYAFISQ